MKTQIITLITALALVGCSSKFEDQDDNPGGTNSTGTDADDTDDDEVDPNLADADGDGVAIADGDCDDDNADVFPGAGDQCAYRNIQARLDGHTNELICAAALVATRVACVSYLELAEWCNQHIRSYILSLEQHSHTLFRP